VADSADFDEFYAATSRRVLGQVYLMTGDLGAAEDAVAEAYARAWERWAKVRRTDSPEAWVRAVAARTAVSSWRKARNRLQAHRLAADEARTPAELGPDHVVLVAALRRLPTQQRRAVVLHYLAGRSVEEIAAETGAAPGSVKSWLHRGRAALNRQLTDPSLHDLPAATPEPEGSGSHGTV
jgi:RNA polymerase sigma-70 factor (ECF subfamily)